MRDKLGAIVSNRVAKESGRSPIDISGMHDKAREYEPEYIGIERQGRWHVLRLRRAGSSREGARDEEREERQREGRPGQVQRSVDGLVPQEAHAEHVGETDVLPGGRRVPRHPHDWRREDPEHGGGHVAHDSGPPQAAVRALALGCGRSRGGRSVTHVGGGPRGRWAAGARDARRAGVGFPARRPRPVAVRLHGRMLRVSGGTAGEVSRHGQLEDGKMRLECALAGGAKVQAARRHEKEDLEKVLEAEDHRRRRAEGGAARILVTSFGPTQRQHRRRQRRSASSTDVGRFRHGMRAWYEVRQRALLGWRWGMVDARCIGWTPRADPGG